MEFTGEMIAKLVKDVLKEMETAPASPAGGDLTVPIGVSNRHVHLTRADVETLFGAGYTLTKMKDLSQPGQYACEETVTVIGPSLRPIEQVRI